MSETANLIIKQTAKRFKVNPNLREDLAQEGYLAYLELVASGKDVTEDKIRSVVLRSMYDYLNFKNLPVTIPINGTSRDAMLSTFDPDKAHPHQKLINLIKTATHKQLDENMPIEDLTYSKVEEEDLLHKLNIAVGELPDREFEIVFNRYFNGLTMQETGDKIGLTKQRVGQLEKQALDKLKERLK